jgi:MFS family permease
MELLWSTMKAFHYGWIIVGMGVLVKMAGLGFGRFAYPMLIPSMRESLGFNYVEMGLLSGAIMLGYLLFSLIGGILATRFGPKKTVIASLLCGSLSMFSIGKLSGFFPLLFFAFTMGAGGAGAHISITTLPMAWFEGRRLGRAVGVLTGGTGLGIIVTGLLLPYLLSHLGQEAWRLCWFLLALTTFTVAIGGWLFLKEKPGEISILSSNPDEDGKTIPPSGRRDTFSLKTIFIIYFIFGFAYNIYTTYFVAYMVEEIHIPEKTAGSLWAVFGWMCIVSGLVWGFLSDRLGRRRALLWNNGVISFALILPLCFHHVLILGLSILLFGFTFLGTVTIIAAAIGDQVGEKRASVYGLVTLVHGIGQLLGTTLGGTLRDLTGSFLFALLSSLVGFLFCFTLTASSKRKK